MNEELNVTTEPSVEEVSRRNGKVARLPKAVRDKINNMLLDGVIYADIIKNLGEDGKHLQICNISRWKDGGFQDWLKERQQVDAIQASFELATDMLENTKAEEIPDMMVKLLAARVGGVLVQTTPNEIKDSISNDPKTLAKIFSLIPRLSRESLRTRKYRREIQREDAQELKQRDPNRFFGDETDHRAVVNIVDKVLGLGQYTPQWIQDLPTCDYAKADHAAEVGRVAPRTPLVDESHVAQIEVPRNHTNTSASASLSSTCEADSIRDERCIKSCCSDFGRGESRREEANHSEISNLKSEIVPTHHTSEPEASSSSSSTQPSTLNPQPATPKWIPVDQRPWNWQEINEYAYMSSFPPDDYQPPTTENQTTNESQTATE